MMNGGDAWRAPPAMALVMTPASAAGRGSTGREGLVGGNGLFVELHRRQSSDPAPDRAHQRMIEQRCQCLHELGLDFEHAVSRFSRSMMSTLIRPAIQAAGWPE